MNRGKASATKVPEVKTAKSVTLPRITDPSTTIVSPSESILHLQRTIGNQAVGSLLKSGKIQAKLSIGQPNDCYEQEADRVADLVMRMTDPAVQLKSDLPLAKGPSTRDEEKFLQTKGTAGQVPEDTSTIESGITSLQGRGDPLSESARAYFEPRFNSDFSQVRVHTDPEASRVASRLNAQAFTIGRDIAFGPGHFSPGTGEGKRLLAHELTHVVQQTETMSSPDRLQREPLAPARPEQGEKGFLPWSMISPPGQILGDHVPGYETPRIKYDKNDIEEFWSQLHQREKDNKANVANFLGAYGEAMVQLWGRHISEVMAEAGKSAGWSFFDKMLKFLAIKTIEIVAATLLTPASVEIFELIGKEVSEKVVEFGIEVVAGYVAEHGAEKLEEHSKDSQIEVAKEDIDKVTKKVSALLGKVTVSTIKSLPDITPYAKRLSELEKSGSYAQLADFRLPPLFPDIKRSVIYRIVAELLIVLLNEASGSTSTSPGGYISVEGPGLNDAEVRVASKDLRWFVGGAAIRDLPLMPLVIVLRSNNVDGIRPIAKKLLPLLRAGAPAENEIDEFIKASGELDMPPSALGYLLRVNRTSEGKVTVEGGSWSQRIYFYQWATSDMNLGRLADEIFASSANSCRDVSEEVGETAVCRILSPSEIATKMIAYLANNEPTLVKGANALITQHVEKLYPVARFPSDE